MKSLDLKEHFINYLRTITSLPMWLWVVIPVPGVFLMFVIGMTAAFTNFFGYYDPKFPTDAEMESTYFENQGDFEMLRQMSNQDSDVTIIEYLPRQYVPRELSYERWTKYRNIFRKLHLDKGISKGNSNHLYLNVYLDRGQKGYLYSEDNLEPKAESLDDNNVLLKKPVVYKKLDNNWYIYLARH